MIKIVTGNILDARENIIVQQVNCKGVMGAGLAKQILSRYPHVKDAYLAFRQQRLYDVKYEERLLGEVHFVKVGIRTKKYIANVFGQVDIKKSKSDPTVYTDEKKLLEGISNVKEIAELYNLSVAIPTHIGCGLGGGDWTSIKKGIELIFKDSKVEATFYDYQ